MRQKTPIESVGVALTSSLDEEEREDKRAAPDPDSPFRILVLGDFSGRESRGIRQAEDLGVDRFPIRVDRDDLGALPERLGARAAIQLIKNGPFLDVPIRRLDDFHPDRIFELTAAFAGLRRTRLDLHDPETFERGAGEVRSWERLKDRGISSPDSESESESEPPTASGSEGEDLVRELLERSDEARPEDAFNRFVEQVVQPYQAPADSPDRDELIERTDEAIGSWMCELLHNRRFQALEVAWRGLDFLIRRVEADGAVEVHVLDITRDELADSLRATDDLSQSAVHELFVRGGSWSLFTGLYTFERKLEDVALLGRLAKVASAAGAPFLAAASPRLVEPEASPRQGTAEPDMVSWMSSFSPDTASPASPVPSDEAKEVPEGPAEMALWDALRELPESRFIGLALPRFLLRLPYGADTDPIEEFPFEEMRDGAGHEALAWGNPALACALLMARSFETGGWHFHPGQVRDVEDLPLYMATRGGETVATPCAERLLSDEDAERMLENGLIPLVSLRGRDAVRVARFQSIARPPRGLDGPWERGSRR